jgi:RNA polymerase sigma-70 factor (ECF subfamily)
MVIEKSDSEELAVYWAQHQPAIAGYISSLISNFQDADDVLQNVAMVTVKKFDEYDREKPFVSWAIGIAKNMVLKYYSEKKKSHLTLDYRALQAVSKIYESEFKTISRQNDVAKNALERCLRQLKGRWKKILEMYYLRELSPIRISQQLGITKNNVFVSLHRVRMALRDCVNDQLQKEQA